MSGDVLMMPGVRAVSIRRLSLERRKELLRELAREYLNMAPESVEFQLICLAHDSVTGPRLQEAWGRFLEREVIADAVDAGVMDWDWRCNSCGHLLGRACACRCCPSASQEARQQADEALHALAAGECL